MEVCLIRPCDVDRSRDVWEYVPSEHKTEHHERSRTIFIGPKAQEVLLPYMLRPADLPCFSPLDSERKRRDQMHAERTTSLRQGNVPGSNRKAKPLRTPRRAYNVDSYRRAIHRGVQGSRCGKVGAESTPPQRRD